MRYLLFILCIGFISGCNSPSKIESEEASANNDAPLPKSKRPVSLENGKFFEKNGKKMLFGGEDSTQHFDVTDFLLKDEQFHYGIGREAFSALLQPEFISIAEADTIWADTTRFLVAYAGDEVKAYAVPDLIKHEVVNDELNGEPIMAAYCILADLGAIYDRNYGGEELTFALSGYTYYDDNVWNGLDGFVLWDRETESLWWPLIGKAVSGPLKNVQLQETDKSKWEDIRWKEVKEKYPTAKILKSGQDFERPKSWEKLEDVTAIKEQFSIE